jgi:hypothetical protein
VGDGDALDLGRAASVLCVRWRLHVIEQQPHTHRRLIAEQEAKLPRLAEEAAFRSQGGQIRSNCSGVIHFLIDVGCSFRPTAHSAGLSVRTILGAWNVLVLLKSDGVNHAAPRGLLIRPSAMYAETQIAEAMRTNDRASM